MSRKRKKVVRYRKPFSLNIGVVIFLLLLVYLAIISYQYFSKDHVTIYEVTKKKIADDNRITGLVLRDEIVVNSDKSGYVNYYTNEGKKISKNTPVCSIDNTGRIAEYLSGLEENEEANVNVSAVRRDISLYKSSFELSNYNKVYDFKYDLENSVLESAMGGALLSDLQKLLDSSGEELTFDVINTQQSGILSFTIDGMEGMTVDDVNLELFDNPEVERIQLRSLPTTESGSPIYKLVPNEEWSIIVPLTYEQLEKLKDKSSVNIKICKDNLSVQVGLSIIEVGEKPFAKLDLQKYMIRYLTDRFLDIELIINSAEGLKIPTDSIMEKECFLIPPEFITAGGDSNTDGIVKEGMNEEGEPEYTFVEIYIVMEEEGYLYIDAGSLSKGDWIQNPDKERLQLNDTRTVEGVYNVNEGFCKFRRIEKVYKNPEYCIIKTDTKYGLSVYDHIVMNPDKLKEEDLIY